jgi:hypothetical protein
VKLESLDALADWIKSSMASHAIVQSQWIWPASETLHFIGLALLVGAITVVDLRMLGVAKGLSPSAVHRLTRWAVAGFAINTITGIVFFVGAPFQYVHNTVFHLKLVFMAAAGINALVFEFSVLPKVRTLGPGADAPPAAKVIAASSLCLWVCVMFLGRMLPFIGEAF